MPEAYWLALQEAEKSKLRPLLRRQHDVTMHKGDRKETGFHPSF